MAIQIMSLRERESLQAKGNQLAQKLQNLSVSGLFFGAFIGLWILACLSLLNRGLSNSWARWAQLIALLVTLPCGFGTFLSYTADIANITAHLDKQVSGALAPFDITSDWTEQIGLLINDAVVIWRAWVLYWDTPIVLFLLCLGFCATVATSFASLALISEVAHFLASSGSISSSGTESVHESMAFTLNNAATVLSLATNLFSTCLIFLRLWRHRKIIGRSEFQRSSLTSSQRIMLFLVEAGAIFSCGQAYDVFFEFYINTNSNLTLVAEFVLNVIDAIFWASLPMYLPAVILLAADNRTIHEYINFDSNLLAEANVEVTGYQEGEPAESSTTSMRHETAQLSAPANC